jgi:hypothetical protein
MKLNYVPSWQNLQPKSEFILILTKRLEKIGEDKHSPVLLNILAQELKVSGNMS